MKRFLIFIAAALALGALAAGAVFLFFLYSGPRMKEQAHLRAYQALVPLPPPESVPARRAVTLAESARALGGPAAASAQDLEHGRTFYTYYCLFCHGAKGDGAGPVGVSYDPAPPDLRSERVRGMAPPRLLTAMLTGVGHEPVLEMVVHPQYRRELLLYVRALAQQELQGRKP